MALLHVGTSPVVFTEHEAHSHDCYEIILNLEGTGEAQIGAGEYSFAPGTIHIVPPNTPHSKRSKEGFRDIYLHTDSLHPAEAAQWEYLAGEPLVLADDAAHTMEGILKTLLARYLLHSRNDYVIETLYQVVLQLVVEWCQYTPADPVVNAVIHRIMTSFNDPEFQVTEALEETGYSKDHLRRRFDRATGMTPNEYLRKVRIRYARRLLRQKERLHLSVNEVAAMSGYYDTAYFCRIFRRETGLTPSEFSAREQRIELQQSADIVLMS